MARKRAGGPRRVNTKTRPKPSAPHITDSITDSAEVAAPSSMHRARVGGGSTVYRPPAAGADVASRTAVRVAPAPDRALGPAIMSGTFTALWLYLLAPIVGGIAAALL